tara:strand:+ start:755 stop:988 length:234 start_codon:yes stop_codon:yes gene_type:complete
MDCNFFKLMINTSNSIAPPSDELCNFISCKLGISQSAIELGIKRSSLENSPLPVVMWRYGLITLSQLKIIYLWLKDN